MFRNASKTPGGQMNERRMKVVSPRNQARRLLAATLGALLAWTAAPPSRAQHTAYTTASRIGDLQIGGGAVYATSNYNFTPIHLVGEGLYTTFDIRNHWGAEFDFHNIKATEDSSIYQRTYEIGPRIFFARGPLIPYGKVLFGRGVYNFSNNIANVAFNIYTYGGGADFQVTRSLNVRADYEYQNWLNFPLTNLHPSVITIGVAYHFHE
jgi:Outer membrane protein beta-barrel domain